MMEESIREKFIDVEKVINAKNPNLLKVMPGFLVRYIKRILHQDEINVFIEKFGHLSTFDFVEAIMDEFGARVTVKGLENLPAAGGCIVASNHPLGALDAMALIKCIGKRRRDMKFVVNDVLLQIKNLEGLFIGVNKHGKNKGEILEGIDRLYSSEIAIVIFPAGLVSRKQKGGVIRDLDWKKSFITKAKSHRKDIIPVYIEGRNRNFFYNLARFRTAIGIKSNIEMFFLVDEMYRQKGQHIDIVFGKPVSWTLFDKQYTDLQWAQKMKEHVYGLRENPNAVFETT